MQTTGHTAALAEKKSEKQLIKELTKLGKILERIENLRPFDMLAHVGRYMAYSFLKGVMVGAGSVLGAAIFLTLFVYILKHIQFAPLVGDFVQDVLFYLSKTK